MILSRSLSIRVVHALFRAALGTAIVALSVPALAQSVTLESQSYRVERAEERPSAEEPYAISYKDCVDDNPALADYDSKDAPKGRTWIRFTTTLLNIKNNSSLQIWVSQGADCKDTVERTSGRCNKVYTNSKIDVAGPRLEAHVYPRVVLGTKSIDNIDVSDPDTYPTVSEVCDSGIEQAYTFFIMIFEGSNIVSTVEWTQTRVDTLGPDPPNSVSLAAGQNSLFVDWSIPSEAEDPDTQGFVLYCARAGTNPDASAGGAGGAGDVENECGTSLIEGELPALDDADVFECGSSNGRSSREGQASGLENEVTYAVAVAARDQVNNSGRLSEVNCLSPHDVTTFFESYRQAGGKGGGGYCSVGRAPLSGWLAACLALLGLGLLRRRKGEHS